MSTEEKIQKVTTREEFTSFINSVGKVLDSLDALMPVLDKCQDFYIPRKQRDSLDALGKIEQVFSAVDQARVAMEALLE